VAEIESLEVWAKAKAEAKVLVEVEVDVLQVEARVRSDLRQVRKASAESGLS